LRVVGQRIYALNNVTLNPIAPFTPHSVSSKPFNPRSASNSNQKGAIPSQPIPTNHQKTQSGEKFSPPRTEKKQKKAQ